MRSPFFRILAILLWLFLGYFYWDTTNKCCDSSSSSKSDDSSLIIDNNAENNTAKNTIAIEPLTFNYNQDDVVLGEKWEDYKADLIKGLKDGERLEIVGKYSADEKTVGKFANMGEARADKTREALGLTEDQVLVRGELSSNDLDKENPFNAVSFRNIGKPKSVEKSIDNKTIIRFPSNSTQRVKNKAIEDYLDQLAVRVSKSGERVRLAGHTDSDGSPESNIILGQQRADIIKEYLVRKGVSAAKIITSSKGETQPIASNSTNSGKAENRRTELEIIK